MSLCSFSTSAGIPLFFAPALAAGAAFFGLLLLAAGLEAWAVPVVVFFSAALPLAGRDLEAAPVVVLDPEAAAARLRVVVFAMA